MNPAEKEALALAVNTLIEDGDAESMYQAMRGVLAIARRGIPVNLTGRPAVLNPLIALAQSDEEAFDRVIDLCNRKRKERGLTSFAVDNLKRSYMREYMAERRSRARRMSKLWNNLLPTADQIKGNARLDFEQQESAKWYDEKTRREEELREQLGRRLKRDELQSIAQQLWTDVDEDLDNFEKFVDAELAAPITRRRSPHAFKFQFANRKTA